jgi:protein SCO1/2
MAQTPSPGTPATVNPLPEIGYDQRLGQQLPVNLALRDETGAAVRLGDLLHGRPAVLVFAYYHCPMLCTLVLEGVASAMKPLAFAPGKELEVIVVSIDPRETSAQAAETKSRIVARYGRPETAAGWHFTTAEPAVVAALTRAAGFRYRYLPERDEYAHAAGLVVLTPEGRIARYLFGLEFPPRDLRLALVEAAEGEIGSVVDQVLLYCFHYDPATGRYSATVMNVVRLAGIATVLALAAFVLLARRRVDRPIAVVDS